MSSNKKDKIIILISILVIICTLVIVVLKILNYEFSLSQEIYDLEMNINEECDITEEKKNIDTDNSKENQNTEFTEEKITNEILIKNIKEDKGEDMGEDIKENIENAITKTNERYIDLERKINELCEDKGLWAIYIKDLKTGESLSINNKKMISASIIKLYIMAKTYENIRAGEIKRTQEVDSLLMNMITISHNESSNKLVELIGNGSHKEGMKVVNEYANSIGCTDTEQQRNMLDSRPKPIPEENYTSVENCGALLEKIYLKECITPDFDEEMMNLLLAQQRNTKLPVLLPKGVKIAHKTGELYTTENDVGIVFGPQRDYIICIMSNEVKNSGEARRIISEISKVTYEFFDVE